jgi:hypothetical protein
MSSPHPLSRSSSSSATRCARAARATPRRDARDRSLPARPTARLAQADLREEREVSDDDALEFARSRGMLYLEASAKTRAGIRQAFEEVRSSLPATLRRRGPRARRAAPSARSFADSRAPPRCLARALALCAGRAPNLGHTCAARRHARRGRRGRRAAGGRCGWRGSGATQLDTCCDRRLERLRVLMTCVRARTPDDAPIRLEIRSFGEE